MGFWIFMLITDLLIPLMMIALGYRFIKKPPNKINSLYGYRSSRSMKNKDTWQFAHRYCGKIWKIGGWILLPVSALTMIGTVGKSEDCIGTVGLLICAVQIAALIGSIILTEKALHSTFDSNGNRR